MNSKALKPIIEGLLFMAGDEGLSARQLAEITDSNADTVLDSLHRLRSDLELGERGLRIAEVAGAFRLTTLPQHANYFERLAYSPSRQTLSQAALETLAIVAYRQPITRVEIEEVRGVKSERALATLVNKELIEEVGRAEAVGRPILYGTTKPFLDYFGLADLEALPEPSAVSDEELLEEQTQMLFEKMDTLQLTIDEIGQPDEIGLQEDEGGGEEPDR